MDEVVKSPPMVGTKSFLSEILFNQDILESIHRVYVENEDSFLQYADILVRMLLRLVVGLYCCIRYIMIVTLVERVHLLFHRYIRHKVSNYKMAPIKGY